MAHSFATAVKAACEQHTQEAAEDGSAEGTTWLLFAASNVCSTPPILLRAAESPASCYPSHFTPACMDKVTRGGLVYSRSEICCGLLLTLRSFLCHLALPPSLVLLKLLCLFCCFFAFENVIGVMAFLSFTPCSIRAPFWFLSFFGQAEKSKEYPASIVQIFSPASASTLPIGFSNIDLC